jgi:hypothetical protein
MGIARVSRKDDAYIAGWLRDTEQTPFQTQEYPALEALFFALDEEIARR